MIIIAGLLGGGLWGALSAKRQKGNGKDMAQYAVAYGIAFGLLGLFVTMFIERML
jgi:high-affinity Fe2+/Pb2+ permease